MGTESEDVAQERRHVTRRASDEPNGGAPIWITILYRYGIPGAIALALVYLLAVTITGTLANIAERLENLKSDHRETAWYLRAICLNSSKDEVSRALCQPPETK